MENKNKIPDVWIYLPLLLLAAHFLYRLIDQSQMLFYFPLDFNNDISSYIAQLHFFKVCGYHHFCSYWYNGFTSFLFTPPGWYLLTYPLLILFKDPKVATYFSILALFIFSFLIIYCFGKLVELSKTKRIALFIFFFGNALAIGNFIRLGRVHELTVWVFFFIFIFTLLYYFNKKLDYKFILLAGISYGFMQISYLTVSVLVTTLWLGYFLAKKERGKIVLAGILSVIISAFWTIPLALHYKESSIKNYAQGSWLWIFTKDQLFTQIAVFIIPLALFLCFYFYYQNSRNKKELLFFAPLLILNALFFLRLTPLIPLFKDVFPDPYLALFLFFTIYFFLQTDVKNYGKLSKLLPYALVLITLLSISINLIHTPLFVTHTQVQKDFVTLLPKLEDNYFLVGDFEGKLYPKAYYSLAATYNKKTVSGWYPEVTNQGYLDDLKAIGEAFTKKDCLAFKGRAQTLKIRQFITYGEDHTFLEQCGYTLEFEQNNIYSYQ